MLGFARLANVVGYLFLALCLILANARLALAREPSLDVLLRRIGWVVAGSSGTIFMSGVWGGRRGGLEARTGSMPGPAGPLTAFRPPEAPLIGWPPSTEECRRPRSYCARAAWR